MKFVDASVFVHAYLRPRRRLSNAESEIKADAQRIVSRISSGEVVLTTTVHLCEVANLMEGYLGREEARSVEEALTYRENIKVAPVSRQDCVSALRHSRDVGLGLSDAIAYAAMKEAGISEIYSFDRDFDSVQGIRRVRS